MSNLTSGSSSRTEIQIAAEGPNVLQTTAPVGSTAITEGSRKLALLAQSPQWQDWHWQMKNRIRSVERLLEYFPQIESPRQIAEAASRFPLAITPYYASLIMKTDHTDAVFLMSVPQGKELWNPPFLSEDPLEEDRDMPVPGLVHRYPDRALLIATTACPMYCRHCTRKRVTGIRESCISQSRIKRSVDYLQKHPEIRDVIVSGGDPFTMSTNLIESVLAALRSVPSIDIIRIGTRTPVTLPMRITDELVAMIRKYHPVWINTHFNHPLELTPEAGSACRRLVDAGIPLGNQTVLLKGVNDDPQIMAELLRGLLKTRVRPYYLFQCDLVRGIEHFRTSISRGIEIMEYLRGSLSGLAIPSYVIDVPHGGGKIPVLPNYIVSASPTHTVLRNCEGMLVSYPEPYAEGRMPPALQPLCEAPSVWDLATGHASKIQPENTRRQNRRNMRSN